MFRATPLIRGLARQGTSVSLTFSQYLVDRDCSEDISDDIAMDVLLEPPRQSLPLLLCACGEGLFGCNSS